MTDFKDASVREAIQELGKEENLLAAADEELARASGRYQVASKRYAAVREAVEGLLGRSPYEQEASHLWPPTYSDDGTEIPPWDAPNWGIYRYLSKGVGDAVAQELHDRGDPMDLEQLVEALKGGGLHVDARAVNASLLNMNGVTKLDGGTYMFGAPPEDLPW